MSAFQSLAPRSPASLETVHNILGSLVARYREEEVLTAIRQIPARDAKFRPLPAWVTSALAEAYRAKGIRELYSHQAVTAELVRNGKNVVVITPNRIGQDPLLQPAGIKCSSGECRQSRSVPVPNQGARPRPASGVARPCEASR
jgi:hypothetical protein